ncbi:hypothetical protein TSUD_114370 [Trifolium subterraneum]|uniref:Uncharacterized protein n=1 Tax=Trifolium subterraneum TaxID=3900 RepID=A0A2Z6NED1_TRISU|nr:hypothetical protein TSUD_114370 [Trifolium subterraneum]
MKRGILLIVMVTFAAMAATTTEAAGREILPFPSAAATDGNCGKITCYCFHPFCPHFPTPPTTTTPLHLLLNHAYVSLAATTEAAGRGILPFPPAAAKNGNCGKISVTASTLSVLMFHLLLPSPPLPLHLLLKSISARRGVDSATDGITCINNTCFICLHPFCPQPPPPPTTTTTPPPPLAYQSIINGRARLKFSGRPFGAWTRLGEKYEVQLHHGTSGITIRWASMKLSKA